jgi:hypothetical protein
MELKKIKNFFWIGWVWILSVPMVSAASTVSQTTHSTSSKNKTSGFDQWVTDLKEAPFFSSENILRGLRVLALVFAILFINILLVGSFRYIVMSGDDNVAKSRRDIAIGLTGTLLAFCVYFWASAVLIKAKVGI